MEEKQYNNGVIKLIRIIMIEEVPSYANKIFYSLGFLSMISLFMLIFSGIILVFFGPNWWLTTSAGVLVRSIHLWSAQSFVVFMMLHILIVFLTSGYKPPRRFVWIFGSLMFFFALIEAEFGYVLRNDFSSQWRSLQAADLYNGSGLGNLINNLNYAQIYGIHIIIIPFLILGLLFFHYGLVRLRGIATPYKKDFKYKIVKADHRVLFLRGFILFCVIIFLAIIFPSPIIAPVTIQQIANQDPSLMANTLISELNHKSNTANYFDTINPYQFDTKKIYVESPYSQYEILQQDSTNMLIVFNKENLQLQNQNIEFAKYYFDNKGPIDTSPNFSNPVIPIISTLLLMGKSSLYESSLRNEANTGNNPTYILRFLSDSGVMDYNAEKLKITTQQYGMLREEKGILPPGAWWLAPLGLMNNTILKNDNNQDRDGAVILGIFMLLFIAFPYIPLLNQIPNKLGIYKLIWKDKNLQEEKEYS